MAAAADSGLSFDGFGLDRRVSKAITKLHFVYPTTVQSQVIPLALSGKDLLVKSKTGSGKTVAYAIPIIQNILHQQEAKTTSAATANSNSSNNNSNNGVKAIILVPTRELVDQVHKQITPLLLYCNDIINVITLQADMNVKQQASQLRSAVNTHCVILVCTPTLLLQHCVNNNLLSLADTLSMLVIDEADLVLSYGYEEDIKQLLSFVPKLTQTLLCSATLTDDILSLKQLMLHNATTVSINDSSDSSNSQLSQLYVTCNNSNDKFLLVYTMLKLGLIRGKILFFLNTVDQCYRLKLLLAQFSITSAVLNAELPYNSRQHILQQFNRGLFDYLIATDDSVEYDQEEEAAAAAAAEEAEAAGAVSITHDDDEAIAAAAVAAATPAATAAASKKAAKAAATAAAKQGRVLEQLTKDDTSNNTELTAANNGSSSSKQKGNSKKNVVHSSNSSYSRGIDYQHVNVVINYEFPTTINSYTHRIGRTARGNNSGLALSLVDTSSTNSSSSTAASESDLLAAVLLHQTNSHQRQRHSSNNSNSSNSNSTTPTAAALKHLNLSTVDVDSFRYRVDDVTRAVTRTAVRECRLNEIKSELLNSSKLKAHFEDNPRELDLLKHDKLAAGGGGNSSSSNSKSNSASKKASAAVGTTMKVKTHLQHVPQYLVPVNMTTAVVTGRSKPVSFSSSKKRKQQQQQQRGEKRESKQVTDAARGQKKRKEDPLQSFEYKQT